MSPSRARNPGAGAAAGAGTRGDERFIEQLARHLAREKEDIVRGWREEMRANPAAPAQHLQLSDEQLEDHLPGLIDALVAALCGGPTPDVEQHGGEHGHQRRAHGYRLGEVLEEMSLFQQRLLKALDCCQHEHEPTVDDAAEARDTMLVLLDRSIHASVRQYTGETEAERDAAAARVDEMNRDLEESHRQKDLFLATLGHELRNSIAPILTSVRILQSEAATPEQRRQACEIIERQARYEARLVDDLLDVNRIARGRIDLRRQRVDLREAVGHGVESTAPAFEAKRQPLDVAVTPDPIPVRGDPIRLAQVVTNLLGNASKFTGAGGRIAVIASREERDAVIRVRDQGIGIAPDVLPHVFDLFAQAETSIDRSTGGLGVGLWLARTLVEMQGGRVEAHSDGLGQGAEFVVRLPLADGAD
jgi:signal transduction histidine kinase